MIKKNPRAARSIGLGILAALVGFSYALATSQTNPVSESRLIALPAGVGTGLKFTNPLLLPGQDPAFPNGGLTSSDPNGFDLGDAVYGSSLVRYLTAFNGVGPYTFTSSTIGSTALNLGLTGRVYGVIPATAGSFTRFTAVVTDASGASRTGTFRVGAYNGSAGTFRFAHDRLSDAKVGFDYITNIEVLGVPTTVPVVSPGPVTFSVVPNTVVFNGVAVSDMESLGLRLFDDGMIAGRPIQSGTLSFTARARNANGILANNRANTSPDQPLTIHIAALDTVETVMGTVAATIMGNAGRPGRDTFSYTAIINSNGMHNSDLTGSTVTLRLGGKTFSTTLDSRGRAQFGDVRVALNASTGILRLSLRNQDFSTLFGSLPDQSKKTVVVELSIDDKFQATEPLYFAVVNRHGHYRLIYGLYRSRQIGGLFQITSLRGSDSFSGTSFRTQFLISQVPDSSSESFGSANDAVINIGPGFAQEVPLFNGRGRFFPPGIASLSVTGRRRSGLLATYPLDPKLTGVQKASSSGGKPQTFLLGMKVTTNTLTFMGAASLKIFPFAGFR